MRRFAFSLIALVVPLVACAAERPNVLFIAVDDLRPELACYGADQIHSPNIDRLARRGMLFTRAYCQQAVCSPSRTSLMTGLRPDSTKVWDLETHFRDHVPDVVTLPQHFQDNGYLCYSMGKIYHGGFDDEKSWSVPALKPAGGEGYVLAENKATIARMRMEAAQKGLKGKALSRASRGPPVEAADVADEAYTDGAVAELGVKTLRALAARDEPFFLAVGFLKPHLPFNSPQKYWDLYRPEGIKTARNPFPPKGAPPIALTNWGELRRYTGIPAEGDLTEEQARKLIHGYYASVSFTDANIGKLLDELDRLGIAGNTVIVLWGDHGWKLGEHGAWCKHTNFEIDANAPLIISAPGQKAAGSKTRALVEFVDIYPTLCELAGLSLPTHLQGTSAAPLLDDPRLDWKPAAFSQYPRGKLMGYSMKTERFRLTVWQDRSDPAKVDSIELYDHESDPGENENVAGDERYKADLARLLAQHRDGWQAAQRK